MSWNGIILIIVGAVLLAANFGLLQWGWLQQWWPVLLIVVGVWTILAPRRGDRRPSETAAPRDVDRIA
ncbi:MAG: DUF5668 domain-containing protein [Pseudomonadota bacterium]|nr:DUF5668 domain-containing protein [Pseudomonadota bacterium]